MNVYHAKFMMYFEIHRMHREGHSVLQISKHLVLNRRTVSKYLSMSEQEYEVFLISQSERSSLLDPYEQFITDKLRQFGDTSAAQMHDWLKERFSDFPQINPKTVFNFICRIREKHNIPRIKDQRQHQTVEELPFGKQAQVDFGEYNMRNCSGKRTKVFFFILVLSRSRFKYLWFTDCYFTTELSIQAHEQAFEYIMGIPDEIVYDQDKVFLVDENKGDIILTDGFRSYARERPFSLYFCRKSDPQSKGKVENVVKYVKQNFLYNRTYHNIDTLNDEAMGWLGRTANALPHAFTRKEPTSQWQIEKEFLQPYTFRKPRPDPIVLYAVRKDNTISYKGNYYSLPLGTYKGRGTLAGVSVQGLYLVITSPSCGTTLKNNKELCRHLIAAGNGLKIINTDHKRDKSAAIEEMIGQLCTLFKNPEEGSLWLEAIRTAKPRYIRDQLLIIRKAIEAAADAALVDKALNYCKDNGIVSAADFKAVLSHYHGEQPHTHQAAKPIQINPLNGQMPEAALNRPHKSEIEDYQAILKNNK